MDLNIVMKTVESVCNTLGLKLGHTWESYLTEMPKLPWPTIFLTSFEIEHYNQDVKERVLYALYYGPCSLKTNDFSSVEIQKDVNAEEFIKVDRIEVQCPENVVRKEEKPMSLDYVINEI